MEGLLFLGSLPGSPKKAHFAINVTSETATMCEYPQDDLTIALQATDSRIEIGVGFTVSP